jgi:hypothetical protein
MEEKRDLIQQIQLVQGDQRGSVNGGGSSVQSFERSSRPITSAVNAMSTCLFCF